MNGVDHENDSFFKELFSPESVSVLSAALGRWVHFEDARRGLFKNRLPGRFKGYFLHCVTEGSF